MGSGHIVPVHLKIGIRIVLGPREWGSSSGHRQRQQNALTTASTGTSVPARVLVSSGVMMIAPRVDAVVIRTDRATSPCAMYVATLDACEKYH